MENIYRALILSLFLSLIVARFGNAIPSEEFFPSGLESGDRVVPVADDNYVGPIGISQAFPFFGVPHHELFVNNNGAVSFNQGIVTFTPVCGPLDRYSKMIAPYWSDVDTNNGGNVYYRESTNESYLEKASLEILEAFPDLTSFEFASWLFIATWDNVARFTRPGSTPCVDSRNTFQLTLVTDGTHSFAIIYYGNMTWTTGSASGGDCYGLGGAAAKAGFDVGDGKTFFEIPGSCTADVLDVQDTSNVAKNGVWVFRIDDTFVAPPTEPTEEPETDPTEEPQTDPTEEPTVQTEPTKENTPTTEDPTTPETDPGTDCTGIQCPDETNEWYFPHPCKCNAFCQCSNGQPIELPCPPEMVYHPDLEVCVTKDEYDCNLQPCRDSIQKKGFFYLNP